MRSPADLRAWARRRFDHQHRDWLGQLALGADHSWSYPLQPPTEQGFAADPDAVARWVAGWAGASLPSGAEIDWGVRRWSSLGHQRLPLRVRGVGSDALAELGGRAAPWQRALGRAVELRRRWPDAGELGAGLTSVARPLEAMAETEFDQLVAVLEFLHAQPASGLWARELPVPGIDSKWMERHQRVVQELLAGITGSASTGLRRAAVRFRVRLLDPAMSLRGLTDFTAPVAELTGLPLAPAVVLVCENLTTVHSLPSIRGAVAVHGQGRAVTLLAGIGWLAQTRIVYWGDLDTHGFAILGAFRQALPGVESVLMDAAALAAFRPLCVPEPTPFRGDIGHLTAAEYAALALVRAEDLRLEQERIGWAYACDQLSAAGLDLL